MKKYVKNLLISTISLSSVFALTGCDLSNPFASANTDDSTLATSVEATSIEAGVSENGFTKTKLNAINTDLKRDYSVANGEQNVLIIPIHLSSGPYSGTWSDSLIDELSDIIFDTEDSRSYVSYYKTASFDNLIMGGEVSELYNSTYSVSQLEDATYGMTRMYSMFEAAAEWVDANDDTVDIEKDYDKNSDGYIDNIHFMIDGSDGDDWNSNIWPHMSQTGYYPAATGEFPEVNTYSLSNLDHLSDATTTIHEQGHIFGLQDYYNYSYLPSVNHSSNTYYDLVGNADMQDDSMFDWNAYSKMNMGWIEPYYFDGSKDSATITISPSGTSGDAIVLGENWNGNAFDEYITLELFTEDGNNAYDWDRNYPSSSNYTTTLGEGGVRVSHVDSRLMGMNANDNTNAYQVDNINDSDYDYYGLKYTNSYDADDYQGYTFDDNNYNLLQVIEADKENEFGSVQSDYSKTFLGESDLFQTGDSFSMSEYSNFFYNKTTLNNGDEFPYEVQFDKVTSDYATITITKI